VAVDARSDGIFPLVTNVIDFSELDLLHAYKRQPAIEKRFSQLKTDFEVAPVYLKAVHRIQALLCMYFFALLVEALWERQLRQAMQHAEIEALPMYPEGRACRWPTARRVIDLFASVQRHTLEQRRHSTQVMVTELTRLQRKLLRLIGLPAITVFVNKSVAHRVLMCRCTKSCQVPLPRFGPGSKPFSIRIREIVDRDTNLIPNFFNSPKMRR
jgi:hypothetical protein